MPKFDETGKLNEKCERCPAKEVCEQVEAEAKEGNFDAMIATAAMHGHLLAGQAVDFAVHQAPEEYPEIVAIMDRFDEAYHAAIAAGTYTPPEPKVPGGLAEVFEMLGIPVPVVEYDAEAATAPPGA